MYLRESDSPRTMNGLKGTPYYIGKGCGGRAWFKHGNRIKVPSNENIVVVSYGLTDQEAKNLEIELILKYGRIDLKSGILMNLTEGGEGVIGTTEEVRAKRRASQCTTWATDEAKARKREATRKVWEDPDYKAKRAATIKKAWADPELRKRHSAKIKETWSDPKLKNEQSERNKARWAVLRGGVE